MANRYLILFWFFVIPFCALIAQEEKTMPFNANQEVGHPQIQNYTPTDYGAFFQNWGAVQDSLGIMYFGNGDGVLSYNGANWNLLELPNKGTVFSLATTTKGRIYVGAMDELGYLELNKEGGLSYVSLLSKLPENLRDFVMINSIVTTKNGVFFGSKKHVLKWDGEKFTSWKSSKDYHLFAVNNVLFKRISGKGLSKLKNNKFELLANGELFSNKIIYGILPFGEKYFLIVTRKQLYIYNQKEFTLFKTNIPEFFEENNIYSALALDNGYFALGSGKKGLLIIDKYGNKKIELSKKNNLLSNCIYGLFQDQSGLLWASLYSGVAKVEYPSPYTFLDERSEAPDIALDIQKYNDTLYVSGFEGLFKLTKDASNKAIFKKVDKVDRIVTDMLIYDDKLLMTSSFGVFEINRKGVVKKIFDFGAVSMTRSKINSKRVFIGQTAGLSAIIFDGNKWILEKSFKGINNVIHKVQEGKLGEIWLRVDKNEVLQVSFSSFANAQNLVNPKIRTFTPKDGLPNNVGSIYYINSNLYFSSDYELFKYDPKIDRFINDKELFAKLGVENKKVKMNFVDESGAIWLIEHEGENRVDQLVAFPQTNEQSLDRGYAPENMRSGQDIPIVTDENNTYVLKSLGDQRIIDLRKFGLYSDFKDSIIWYKGYTGVVRNNLKIKKLNVNFNAKSIITKVLLNDSLLFGGYESSIVHQLPFKNNQLRFKYASPSFYDESKNQFQVYLEGFDEAWSSWTLETQKDYTNIPEGDYVFKVRSKNIFKHIGKEDSYAFTIIPPWYRAWYMYLIYVLSVIVLFFIGFQWRSKELKRENKKLEEIVSRRTTEIQHKNELLNQQTEKLVVLNDARTKLYANITHEFRTPLTVILGMTDTLVNKQLKETEKPLEMIKRNGKKLLHLVNEMLDIAKLESGNMDLQLIQTNIVPFVKYLSESFHSLAETKKINLIVYSEIEALEMDFDANKIASIISNLLSNAIKFTPEYGKIVVHLNKTIENESDFFVIKIKDNGIGLAKEVLKHLFDRFYQVDNSATRQAGGTGIGLSLTKEFTELMQGSIAVVSTLGKGSTFTVQLPVTKRAIKKTEAIITVESPVLEPNKRVENIDITDLNTTNLPLVLIIEDNEDVAHYLKSCLKGKYQTMNAINGIDGIEMALKNMPDIIISDVMMPGKDGFEVCATLKSHELTDHIPIIMLTAKATIKDRLTGLAHGADAYLAKPFVKAELFTRLDQLVALRKKMLKKFQNNDFGKILTESTPETKFIKKTISCIHERLDDSNFGASQLAIKLHLSESQLYRKLKVITDKSTAIFIRSVRLQKGKELLQTTDKTVSEIAYEVGFNNPSWFSKAFKDEFGFAPSDA